MTASQRDDPRPRRQSAGDRAAPWARPLLFVIVIATIVLGIPGARERFRSPYSGIQARNLVVQTVRLDGLNAHADLRPGDELYAIDGERLRNAAHYEHVVASNRSFHPQSYQIRRNGVAIDVPIEYQPIPHRLAAERVMLIILAMAFLAVGLSVYFRRPDIIGTLFAFNSALLAALLTDGPSTASPILQLVSELASDAVTLFFPAVLLHFFLRFPERENGKRRRAAWVYTPPLVIFAASAAVSARRFGFSVTNPNEELAVLALSTAYFVTYVLASLVVFVRAYRAAPSAQKQKLRVVIAANLAGLLPFVAATLHASIRPQAGALPFTLPAVLCLGLIPLGFAYAILKHGAIELTTVVRKSLVYAVLTGLLIAAYYAVVQTAGAFLSSEFGVSEAVWVSIAVVVLAVVFAPVRERIQAVVDRVFYRTDFVYKQEVIDFGRQVSRTLTRDEVLDHFVQRCDALLHPAFVAIYLRSQEDKDLALVREQGSVPKLAPAVAAESFLGRYLTRFRRPLMVEFLDRSWQRPRLDPEARRLLSTPGLAVCLPIAAPDRLVGIALLGQKRSGLAYRRADAELLETFAEQLSLVVEHADLIRSSIEKERLKSEVMLARDIQQALLPVAAPRLREVEIRGQMISSSEVGGDYFDYFVLDDRRVVVAIGDVMGKGVPAAMLMASLQAVFKNRALKGGLAPHELNRELNDYMVDHAKPGQFATFFCGVLDLATSTFTFSSAGQCPALLATNGYIDRLGNGGTILGANKNEPYVEGSVAFHPGDLLLLYTDGVIEQMSPAGEPYGEQRLVDFLRSNRNLPPDRLQNALLADVLAFGGGQQHDDITSVIAVRKIA